MELETGDDVSTGLTREQAQELLHQMEKELVACFVYGTLRVSEGNHSWADGYVPGWTIPMATTKGQMWFVYGSGGYPVCDLDMEGELVGDVLFWDRTKSLAGVNRITRVEVGAGYVAREVECKVDFMGHEGLSIKALAWHHPLASEMGNHIPDGNWCAASGIDDDEEWYEDDDDTLYEEGWMNG